MCKGCHDHPQKNKQTKKRSKVLHDWQKAVYDSQRPLALGATPGKSSVAAKKKKIHIFTKGVTKARSKHRNAHVPNLMQMRENNRSSADRIKFATCEMRRFKRALLASTPTFPKTAFIHLHTFMSFTEEFFRPIIYICMFIYFPKSSNFSLL